MYQGKIVSGCEKLSDDRQVYIPLFTPLPLSPSPPLSLSPPRGMMGTFVTLLSLQLKNRPLSLLGPDFHIS